MSENDTTREVEISAPPIPPGTYPAPSVSEITEPTTGALQRLQAQAAAMDDAYKIAKALSATEMVPEIFQRNYKNQGDTATWNLAAAILYGAELGLTAVQSAQNVFVVHGKPAVYARTMAAQVRRAGYKIEEVSATDEAVVWRGLRDGHWASSEWTMERATQAGYTSNQRYQTNPQEMLRAKAIAEVCRIQFQDVLLGMAYTVEELQLENITVTRPVREGVRGTAKLREIAEAAQADDDSQPPTPDEAEAASRARHPSVTAPEPASGEQQDRIKELYKARGVNMTGILEDISVFLQRDKRLPHLRALSAEDADAVIENLTQPEQQGD